MIKDKIYEACQQLLPVEVLRANTREELIAKYAKRMGYYYAITTTLFLQDDLKALSDLPKSEDWVALYNHIKDDIEFRPKYKINPNVYYCPETKEYKSMSGGLDFLNAYKVPDQDSLFLATYAYTKEGFVRPTFILTRPDKSNYEFELFVQEVQDSVLLNLGNANNIITKPLKEAELVGLVSDSSKAIAVFKLGQRLRSHMGARVSEIEPSYEGELLKLY